MKGFSVRLASCITWGERRLRSLSTELEDAMARRAIVDAPGLGKALGPYSRAVWAGNILYLSGQTGADPASGALVAGGAGAETEQILKGLAAVLGAAGLGMENVIKANVFLTDIKDFAAMNAVYEKHFGDPRPARTTVAVAALPGGAHVEIEVVAAQ
jgi:2-iminobutanoate/2-iminopropanoate deaminase